MGILSGALSGARFRVEGELPAGYRDVFRDRLNATAFQEPPQGQGKEEVEGWVLTQNLLDTDFTDLNRWLIQDYALLALRVDKKRLPARLFRATLEKRVQAWCAERGLERCPAAVKNELKDNLEAEWLARTLPSVGVTEAVWSIEGRYLVLGTHSESTTDRFRKRFLQTFGLHLVPWSPLDWLATSADVEALLAQVPSDVSLGGA